MCPKKVVGPSGVQPKLPGVRTQSGISPKITERLRLNKALSQISGAPGRSNPSGSRDVIRTIPAGPVQKGRASVGTPLKVKATGNLLTLATAAGNVYLQVREARQRREFKAKVQKSLGPGQTTNVLASYNVWNGYTEITRDPDKPIIYSNDPDTRWHIITNKPSAYDLMQKLKSADVGSSSSRRVICKVPESEEASESQPNQPQDSVREIHHEDSSDRSSDGDDNGGSGSNQGGSGSNVGDDWL